MASDGYRNFRLRGIPDSFQNRKQVRELVRTALRLDDGAEVAVHSLARSPLERHSRIATLTFESHLPKVLEGPQTEWIFTVPGSDEDEDEKWGPQRLVFDTHFKGFTPLHRADDSECSTDLIAISGLAGHAFGSFKARRSSFMWLRDDLPVRLRQTRILVYGYDTKVVASSSFQNLNDLGNMFRYSVKRLQLGSSVRGVSQEELLQAYSSTGVLSNPPHYFLGHSLGGLVVKEAIMKMKGSRKTEDMEFLDNIIAFLFFGVPHQGMATEHLFPMVGEQPNRSLIQSLGKHSAILQRYEDEFSEALDTKEPRPEILSFYETEMSPTAKFNEEKQVWEPDETRLAVLVDRSSATNGSTCGCAIARNHSEMVKFTSEMDEMYDIVLALLLPLLDENGITSKPLSENQRECLKSLFFSEQNFRQAEIHDAENTCAWLLDDPHYRHWIRQPRGLLWVKGKPGAGKSVLMKYASEKLREKSSGSADLVSSFYIHGRGVNLQKTVTGVYRALLHDLIPHFQQTLSQATASFQAKESRYGSYREGRWEWTESELEKFLLQLLMHTSAKRRIVIFIDALDECEKDAPIKLLTCLKQFGERIERQKLHAKICFSSRHYPILGQAQVPTIVVEDRNREDIRQVMEEKLKDIEPDKERERIVEVIHSKDDGVFQWAVLVADKAAEKYRRGFGVRVIEREIETLPAELDNLYAGLLGEVNENEVEKGQTIKLFRWILFACRPLSVRELRKALVTDPNVSYATISDLREHDNYAKPAERFERRVIDMSKGLIEFNTRDVYESFGGDDDGSDRQAEFIHQSVPDFLLEYFLKPAEAFDDIPHSSAGCGHFELAQSCLRYLTISEIRVASKLPRVDVSIRYPLVAYATRYFFTHVQRAEVEKVNQSDLAHLLQWDEETTRGMARLWRTFDPQGSYSPVDWPFEGGNVFHVLAALGSKSALKAMLCKDDIEIDLRDSSKNTPLLIALREGHHDIVHELLNRSAKWLYRHREATRTKTAGTLDVNPLPISSKSYFVDVDAENDNLETPMTIAVSSGAFEVLWTLIEAGASLEYVEPSVSPLLYSIRENNKTLLIKLIENGVKLDGAVYYALARMASENDEDMKEPIKILLETGANSQPAFDLIDYATDAFYDSDDEDAAEILHGSALRIAAHMKDLSILQLLLSHGSYTPEELVVAFKQAVLEQRRTHIELLLTHGSDLPEEVVRDAFLIAAEIDDLLMAILLLSHKSNMGSLKPWIHDVLLTAVVSGNGSLALIVLNHTTEMDWSNSEAYDMLVAAVRSAKPAMSELLLSSPAMASNLEPKSLYGALLAAIVAGDASITTAFLLQKCTGAFEPKERHHALRVAMQLDRSLMVELLLHHFIEGHSSKSEILHNALNSALELGQVHMAELLWIWGAEISHLEPQELRNHLVSTIESGDVQMAEFLLHRGVDIDAADEKDAILAAPALASVLTLNVPTIQSQLPRRTHRNKGGLLSGALLYYALERHRYRVFRLLLCQKAYTTNVPNSTLVKLLIAKRASFEIDANLRDALQDARLHQDKIGIGNLVRLIRTVHYEDNLAWPPEHPTEREIAEVLTSAEMEDYHGTLLGVVAKAVMRNNEELVDFMLKYVGARSDSMTGALDWRPGPNTDAKLTELQLKILDVTMAKNGGYVAPIVLAVAFKRVSIAKLLLDIGVISGESLVQAGFLVTSLNLSEFFDLVLPKLAQSRFITFRTSPAWPFLPYDSTFADHFSQDWGSFPLISQWCSSFDLPFYDEFLDV